MAANEGQIHPVIDAEPDTMETPTEGEIPLVKSRVNIDPNPLKGGGRFHKTDVVHMSLTENGTRTKRSLTVVRSQYNTTGRYYEYQLEDTHGVLYKGGAWIRERDLRIEKLGSK